jgi:undecaprenyl diphosphate synthase
MSAAAEPISAPVGMPRHVAIIMDGNGRWAKRRHLPRALGHREGAEAVRRTVSACADRGIEVLTLFAFSSENWKRPADEVTDLMGLLRLYLQQEVATLDRNNIRIRFIGERARLSPDVTQLISDAEVRTDSNSGMTLVIALNYGGQEEIAQAARRLAEQVAAGTLQPAAIDGPRLAAELYTAALPDPDLIIRTSGEQRLSNFLLWQAAYAEFIFSDVLWPDFSESDLEAALAAYAQRDRRFGARDG